MTDNDIEDLDDMEERVLAAYLNMARDHTPDWPMPDAWTEWLSEPTQWTAAVADHNVPQFPREQWVILPNRRRLTLTIIDNAVRRIAETGTCTPLMLAYLASLMTYGGRWRVA